MAGSRTVFLSYASQDAVAASRIAASLREAGIEVWFDVSELRGGDLWHQSILKQIRECRLFLPIISSATEARGEGYFRLEWKLAVDRSHLMAGDQRFIVPVVIDETIMESARVPDPFRDYQWMRLPRDGRTDDLKDRILQLFANERNPAKSPTSLVAGRISQRGISGSSGRGRGRRYGLRISLIALVTVGVVMVYPLLIRPSMTPGRTRLVPASSTLTDTANDAAIPEQSVAVLPFVDMSERKDQEYLADGLSEELINQLTKIPDLRVPARTSSFYFKGKPATIAEIGKLLGVSHVLEGSVRKSGNKLRITTQLIRAHDGYHLWSQTFDREVSDVFTMEDEISQSVTSALKVSLKAENRPTYDRADDPEAYTLYLRAVQLRRSGDDADQRTALSYLDQAVSKDPGFALAWTQRSGVLDDVGRHAEAKVAALHALELGPESASAHIALSRVLFLELDAAGAKAELLRALKLDPGNTLANASMGLIFTFEGDFVKAIEIAQGAISRDPMNPNRHGDLGEIYFYAGRYSESTAAYRNWHDLQPHSPLHENTAENLLASGDAAAALAELNQEPDEHLRTGCSCRVLIYDALSRPTEANAALEKLQKEHPDDGAYGIGRAYANRNQADQAFMWFDRALKNRSIDLLFINVDPLIKNIRTDRRYKALLAKLKLT